jgi:uroporphyrinogen III methyltransferase/synthase
LVAAAVKGVEGKPAGLVVVGDVARFGFTREWGALKGQRVLLTCSAALQDEACRSVRAAGGVPLPLPLIRMNPTPAAADVAADVADYDWLIVTSPSAVRCLLQALREAETDLRALPAIMACGPGTLRELKAAGLNADAVPTSGFGAEGLLPLVKERIAAGARVLRVRSDRAGRGLADRLREQVDEVDDVCIYRNEPVTGAELPECDVVFFASSSAVTAFIETWGSESLADRTVLAIGQPTAKTLQSAGLSGYLVSPEATVSDAIGHLAANSVNSALAMG